MKRFGLNLVMALALALPPMAPSFGLATVLSVAVASEVQAKKNKRKAAKKKMTKAERRGYRATKKKLAKERKEAKTKVKDVGSIMVAAHGDAVKYRKAMDKSYNALRAQRNRLENAKAKTGVFKPSAKKIASMERRYNKARKDYKAGPEKQYNDRAKIFNKYQKDFGEARQEMAKSVVELAKHRLTVGGRIGGPQQAASVRRSVHGQFIKLTSNELKSLDYGKIPGTLMRQYDRAPVPQQIYGGFAQN